MYTKKQIGKKTIRSLNSKSKDRYALYVEQNCEHEPVLVGVDYSACLKKVDELIDNGVNPDHIYGEQDAFSEKWFGHARMHLWLPEQRASFRPDHFNTAEVE